MPDETVSATPSGTMEVTTAADLAKLRAEGKPLTAQERKELNTRIRAFEEMAQMEDRLRALEHRKRSHDSEAAELPIDNPRTLSPTRAPSNPREHRLAIHDSIEYSSDSSSSTTGNPAYHRRKRQRYSRGIKVTPTYTLKVSSSLREWGDWKRDIERVFEGDPYTYQSGGQKILKALDYLDSNLKSLWYTHSEQKED